MGPRQSTEPCGEGDRGDGARTMSVKVAIDVDPEADMRAGICSFCRKRVTKDDGFLNFYTEHNGSLFHPSHSGTPVALFSHATCGPDHSWLAFDQIADGGLSHHVA